MAKAHAKSQKKGKTAKEFNEVVIQIDRVTRVVKGGRRLRFRATVAIGDMKGRVGIGLGKSVEVASAIQKAVSQAKKNLITVPLDGATIPHDIQIKYKSSKIRLIPAGPGTGIIAGGSVRKVLELAGVNNILSKSLGSSNRVNNAKATVEALKELRETERVKNQKSKKATVTKEVKSSKPGAPVKQEAKKADTPKAAPKKQAEKSKKDAPKKADK